MRISDLLRQGWGYQPPPEEILPKKIKTLNLEPFLPLFEGLKAKGWQVKMKSRGQISAVFSAENALPAVITFSITIANEDSVDYRGMAQLDATWPSKWLVKGVKDVPVQEPYSTGMVKLEPELFGFWPQDRERFLATAKIILKHFENATPQNS